MHCLGCCYHIKVVLMRVVLTSNPCRLVNIYILVFKLDSFFLDLSFVNMEHWKIKIVSSYELNFPVFAIIFQNPFKNKTQKTFSTGNSSVPAGSPHRCPSDEDHPAVRSSPLRQSAMELAVTVGTNKTCFEMVG